jgi:predicted ester cyclase
MSAEENKATLKRLYDEAWNKGNMSVIPELVSSDFIWHTPGKDYKGTDGYKELIDLLRVPFPDLHFTIDKVVAEGDQIAFLKSGKATHTGKFMNAEPTGREVNWKQAIFSRYKDGKVVESASISDLLTIFRQIGIAPPGYEIVHK